MFTFVVQLGDVVLARAGTETRPVETRPAVENIALNFSELVCISCTKAIRHATRGHKSAHVETYLTPKLKAGALPLVDSLVFLPVIKREKIAYQFRSPPVPLFSCRPNKWMTSGPARRINGALPRSGL